MSVKQRHKEGDVVVAANGYSYTYEKDEKGDKLVRYPTSWLVGKKIYGRFPYGTETVRFKDGDRSNLKDSNIEYVPKTGTEKGALKRRKTFLEDRIRELKAELRDVEKKLAAEG